MKLHALAVVALTLAGLLPGSARREPPAVVPNDNRRAGGLLRGDTLEIHLVLDLAVWRPEGADGPSVVVPAIAEEGGAPRIPAPLIRVPEGTVIRASFRNALDSAYVLQGFFTRPGTMDDTAPVAARSSRTITFAAGAAGTYLYAAVPAGYVPPANQVRAAEREQASGALIVDPAGGAAPDRILFINIWGERPGTGGYRNALAINGLSWPHTERIEAFTGDTVRWRVINGSARAHPMHLHGFYFRVESRGGAGEDRMIPAADRWLAVTENLRPQETMVMSWVAERPGNWLFHCHLSFHVVPATRLDPPNDRHDRTSHEATRHMAGLVTGVHVRPRPGYVQADRSETRQLRLYAQEGARRGRALRTMGYVLQRGAEAPAPDSLEIPGSLIVATRDVPTDITVINRLPEPVAVHWHGLELESWSDGVAGWSGADTAVAPAIAPGDSFRARLTVPRAGTFIYHTHMNDIEQITSGLYGAIVVLEPGQPFDPASDHVFVIGWDGDGADEPPSILVNGDSMPRPLRIAAGVTHRFRFVNIGPAGGQTLELKTVGTPDTLGSGKLVEWRRVARDGAELAPSQATSGPARHLISVGQTADFEVRLEPGEYRLSFRMARGIPPVEQAVIVER